MNLPDRIKTAWRVLSRGASDPRGAAGAALRMGGVWSESVGVPGGGKGGFTNADGPVSMLEIAAAYRCVALLSQSIAALPLRYLHRRRGVMVPCTSSPLYEVLTVEPCGRLSAFYFWRLAIHRMVLDGAVYLIPRRDTAGVVRSFDMARAANVHYNDTRGTYTVGALLTGGTLSRSEVLAEEDIIVLRYQTPDALVNAGAGVYAHRAIEQARAAEDETMSRIADGGTPRLLLTGQSVAVGVGAAVEESLRGVARALDAQARRDRSRALYVPPGVSATPVMTSSADLQLQSVREFVVRDICRVFGVPPIYVFSDSTSNYKSVEAASTDFLVNTLDPIMRGIEAEMLRKLAPRGQRDRVRFEFDRSARSASDMESRARFMSQMLSTGAYTVNEIRARMNMPPVDGGDTPLVSANLRPITDNPDNPEKIENTENND